MLAGRKYPYMETNRPIDRSMETNRPIDRSGA